jgi:transcriptional regulator with XRE-family HTH domain
MTERERIGLAITKLRKEKNMLQADLAEKSGTTKANICRIEAGKYSVGLDILVKVATALDMQLNFTEPIK